MLTEQTSDQKPSRGVLENLSKSLVNGSETSKYNQLLNSLLKTTPNLNSVAKLLNMERQTVMAPPLPSFNVLKSTFSEVSGDSTNSHSVKPSAFDENRLKNTTSNFASKLSDFNDKTTLEIAKAQIAAQRERLYSFQSSEHSQGSSIPSNSNGISAFSSSSLKSPVKPNYVSIFKSLDAKKILTQQNSTSQVPNLQMELGKVLKDGQGSMRRTEIKTSGEPSKQPLKTNEVSSAASDSMAAHETTQIVQEIA